MSKSKKAKYEMKLAWVCDMFDDESDDGGQYMALDLSSKKERKVEDEHGQENLVLTCFGYTKPVDGRPLLGYSSPDVEIRGDYQYYCHRVLVAICEDGTYKDYGVEDEEQEGRVTEPQSLMDAIDDCFATQKESFPLPGVETEEPPPIPNIPEGSIIDFGDVDTPHNIKLDPDPNGDKED